MPERDPNNRLGIYAPPTNEDEGFDAREDSRRGPLLLTAAFFVFVLFIGVVWSAYNQGLREGGRDAPPRIVAGEEPYRQRPADPGGFETPDQNIDVYRRIDGPRDAADVTPRPGPEEPIEEARPRIRVETVDADQVTRPAPGGDDAITEAPPVRLDPDATGAVADRNQPGPTDLTAPVETPPPAAALPDPPPAPVTRPAASGGEWTVQIGSYRSEEEAESAWVTFTTRLPQLARGNAPDVSAATIEGRGVYHRLRIGAFETRDDASDFCARLQAGGQDCFVARR